MSKVRTRFAPSPTGRMHVGNLRTALYAYLVAKHEGGDFILRIEDTDQERYVEGAVDIIYRTLAETGLIHDEGPDKDGGCGPYVQSERQAQGIYLEYAKKLMTMHTVSIIYMTMSRIMCWRFWQNVRKPATRIWFTNSLQPPRLRSRVPALRQSQPPTITWMISRNS